MSAVAAETIRQLLACNVQAVEKVASKLSIPKVQATRLREQWARRLTGRCVYCGKPSGDGTCESCGNIAPEDKRQPTELLESLEPSAVLMKRRCLLCQKNFNITVEWVLRMFETHGVFKFPHVCSGCKKGRKFENRPFTALKAQKVKN